jgi:phosphoenolpyruvate synthase/pyruvate phosphate dikinase
MFKEEFNKVYESVIKDKMTEDKKNTTDILKDIRKKVKIKTIIPTKFGIEVVLFNPSDAQTAGRIAKTHKIEGNSIFLD